MTFKTKLRTIYTFVLALGLIHRVFSQSPPATTPENAASLIRQTSMKEMGNNLRLYTGAEYIPNGQHALGYPYFQSDILLEGSLYYDGATYENIFLQYDLVAGELITRDTINNASIRLVKEKIPWFTLSGHYFLWLPVAGDSNLTIDPGYYELLSRETYPLFARYEKKLVFPSSKEEEPKYIEIDNYYLKMHDRYIHIEGPSRLLNLLKDKKEALKKFVRQNKQDLKNNTGEAYARILRYYTELNN